MEQTESFKDLIYLLCSNTELEEKTVDVLIKYIVYLPVDKYCMLCNELKSIVK